MLLGHNTCRILHFFFTKGLYNFCFLKWGADPYWYRSGSRIWILIGFGSRKKENGYWSRQKRVQYQENLINLIKILILTFPKIKIKNIFSVFVGSISGFQIQQNCWYISLSSEMIQTLLDPPHCPLPKKALLISLEHYQRWYIQNFLFLHILAQLHNHLKNS